MDSIGQFLKRERLLRDISINDISEATKIIVPYLEALESDKFKGIPGGKPFVIGYLRNYANFVGLDENEVVTRFLQFQDDKEGKKERVHDQKSKEEKKSSNFLPITLAIVVLVVLIIVLFLIKEI
jgi:cytoskeletal protein RodZ